MRESQWQLPLPTFHSGEIYDTDLCKRKAHAIMGARAYDPDIRPFIIPIAGNPPQSANVAKSRAAEHKIRRRCWGEKP